MVAVYSHIHSPRLDYVLRFCSAYFDIPFQQVTAVAKIPEGSPCIWHDPEPAAEGTLWMEPGSLLIEKSIKPLSPGCFQHPNGYTAFFRSNGWGFDVFAAVFYLLSRYEEYGQHDKDSYGRYAHENSLAFRNGFLQQPLVHIWLNDLGRSLWGDAYRPPDFQVELSYDIDMAWSYTDKGLLRQAGGFLRSMAAGNWQEIRERMGVLFNGQSDPFDCFDRLDSLHGDFKIDPTYFILAANQRTQYDKNNEISSERFQKLVAKLASRYRIGLHPSWYSGDHPSALAKERAFLKAVTNQDICHSRQHYIRFSLPQTFRRLLEAGIRHDHSMGYGSINGFRASVSIPYRWYDLESEKETELWLHPFCFMDANSYYEQHQSVLETEKELRHYTNMLRQHGGRLATVWHNMILGSSKAFSGWTQLHESFLASVSTNREYPGMGDQQ